MDKELYLSGGGRSEGENVGDGRDDIDGEANEQRSDGGVDGAEEGEDDGEEPDWHHHGEACRRSLAHAPALVHADRLLPHEVQRRACEPERYELHMKHAYINYLLRHYVRTKKRRNQTCVPGE